MLFEQRNAQSGSSRLYHRVKPGNSYLRRSSKAASFLSKDLTDIETNRPLPKDFLLAGGKIRVRFPPAWGRNDTAKHFLPLAENQGLAPPKRHLNLARELLAHLSNCHAFHVTHFRCNRGKKSMGSSACQVSGARFQVSGV